MYYPVIFEDRASNKVRVELDYTSDPGVANFNSYFKFGSLSALSYDIGSWARLLIRSETNNAEVLFAVDREEETGTNPFTVNPEKLEIGFAYETGSNLVYYVRELRAWSSHDNLNSYACK